MTALRDLHAKWSMDPTYRRVYSELKGEFAPAEVLARASAAAGLTQATSSTRALKKFAHAIGARLRISFEPGRSR